MFLFTRICYRRISLLSKDDLKLEMVFLLKRTMAVSFIYASEAALARTQCIEASLLL